MMVIRSVFAAKQHLYDVVLDDGTHGQIDKTIWAHACLSVDDTITEEEWMALCRRSEVHRAREKALYYLSLRDYGRREMITKLVRVGIDRSLAEQVVDPLCESGVIDDARYAAMLAKDMSERKLYSRRRIIMALKEKGFDHDAIDAAILQIPEEDVQQALELLRKKRYNKLNMPASRDKVLAMLARYGFSYATSCRAMAMLEEEEEGA